MLAASLGCGGSTTGTGGVTIEGKVLGADTAPLNGVLVTTDGSAGQAVTDSEGNFEIYVDAQTSYSIRLTQDTVSAAATIADIPQGTTKIQATIVFAGQDDASVTDVNVESNVDDQGDSNSDSSSDEQSSSGSYSGATSDDGDNQAGSSSSSSGSTSGSGDDGIDDDGSGDTDGVPPSTSSSSDDVGEDGTPGSSSSGGTEQSNVSISGPITSIGGSSLTVNGTTFVINRDTEFVDSHGHESSRSHFTAGMNVKVHGEHDNGQLRADKVTELAS